MANLDYKELKHDTEKIVYVIQEIPGTKEGRPKINIMGAQKFGKIKVLLREDSQMIFSPGHVAAASSPRFHGLTFPEYALARPGAIE